MPDEPNLLSLGDPEAVGAALASSAMEPATTAMLEGSPLLKSHYDPSRSLAANALDPEGLSQAMSIGLGLGPGAIRAFHGTPHVFQAEPGAPLGAFKDEAIGSGEGAQVYGWGHYVAGNEKVAKRYQEGLAGSRPVPADEQGNPLSYVEAAKKYFEPGTIVPSYGGGFDRVLKFNEGEGSNWSVNVQAAHFRPPNSSSVEGMKWGDIVNNPDLFADTKYERPRNHSTYPTDKEMADIGQARGWEMKTPGSLLEIHVLPDESELLDWDKPLSEQSPGVQAALNKFLGEGSDVSNENVTTGGYLYKYHGMNPGGRFTQEDEWTSKALHKEGIPGIKFADQFSRDAYQISQKGNEFTAFKRWPSQNLEEDFSPSFSNRQEVQNWIDSHTTRNYVIFSPSNLRIVGRNGERLVPVDHDPFASE